MLLQTFDSLDTGNPQRFTGLMQDFPGIVCYDQDACRATGIPDALKDTDATARRKHQIEQDSIGMSSDNQGFGSFLVGSNPHHIDPAAQCKHAQQLGLDQFGVFDDDYVHDTISAAV